MILAWALTMTQHGFFDLPKLKYLSQKSSWISPVVRNVLSFTKWQTITSKTCQTALLSPFTVLHFGQFAKLGPSFFLWILHFPRINTFGYCIVGAMSATMMKSSESKQVIRRCSMQHTISEDEVSGGFLEDSQRRNCLDLSQSSAKKDNSLLKKEHRTSSFQTLDAFTILEDGASEQNNTLLSDSNRSMSFRFIIQDDDNDEELEPDDKPKRKSVRFPAQLSSLQITKHISRLSSRGLAEIKAMWGDEKEEEERKEKIRRDLDRIQFLDGMRTDNDDSGLCALGLDDKVGTRAQEKMEHREQAWDAVMWNQHDQLEGSNHAKRELDDEEVAKVYQADAGTQKLQQQAQEEAYKLAQEINNIRNDPDVADLMKLSERSTATNNSASKQRSIKSSSKPGGSKLRSSLRSTVSSMRSSISWMRSSFVLSSSNSFSTTRNLRDSMRNMTSWRLSSKKN